MVSGKNVDARLLGALRWRCIGPHRGGRVVAVAGHPRDPLVFYFGACAGGVWKTSDGGTYWENISDGFFATSSVGAIAVAEDDPNVMYVGMGESCIRGNVSFGDGVYKSTDGGKTWANVGLRDTRHIGRIRIHPRDSDVVYVAALGHAFGPNAERGVFRSKDGGKNWQKVLFRSEKAGAIDLSMDPNNPRILYAAIWEAHRTPWSLISGGPESGIFKTVDGGDTWTELTRNSGLPEGLKGRIGVAASPAKNDRVWATIEADEPGVFRSDDGGATWELMTDNRDVQARPWYYQHIFADPQDPDTVWVLSSQCFKSVDGGKTFAQVSTPHGDNHDLWMDPRNPRRMIEGNDGGANVSFNGGESWSTIYNQPTAQIYHVRTDNRFPYRVYGTQQDNTAISVPSATRKGAIPWGDCYVVGSAESGHIAVHAENPDVVFSGAIGSSPGGGGNLLRYDHSTGQTRIVTAWPEFYTGWGAKDHKYRFQWTYPIMFSPHDPKVLYITGNMVFRSTDQGNSWEAISPDLTRHDLSTLEPSGGPITKDTSGAETYATIFAFTESPIQKGLFWAGSDDGLLHISRDGGKSWVNVTPKALPERTLVSTIEASPHDPATAYVAATRYKLDDPRPMLYKTSDYGKSWTNISRGIPENDYTRVIREDPARRGLVYAGTETSAYVSFDDGASWQSLQANLPKVPVYDLFIKENDLIAATHGRSFWILDDLTQIHQIADGFGDSSFHLLKPADTPRLPSPPPSRRPTSGKMYQLMSGVGVTYYESKGKYGETLRKFLDAGENPPGGVVVTYYLRGKPEGEVTLSFLDARGQLVKSFSSKAPQNPPPDQPQDPRVPAEAGMGRFIWDMRYPPANKVTGDKALDPVNTAPLAPPGKYQVMLTVNGKSQTQKFEILKDPRVAATQADLDAQFELLLKLRDRLSETNDSINRLRSIRRQVDEWVQRANGHTAVEAVSAAGKGVKEKLAPIETELMQVEYKGERDRLNLPAKLNRKLAELMNVVTAADFAPPKQAHDVFNDISGRIEPHLRRLREIEEKDVPEFINLIAELDLPTIAPTSKPQ